MQARSIYWSIQSNAVRCSAVQSNPIYLSYPYEGTGKEALGGNISLSLSPSWFSSAIHYLSLFSFLFLSFPFLSFFRSFIPSTSLSFFLSFFALRSSSGLCLSSHTYATRCRQRTDMTTAQWLDGDAAWYGAISVEVMCCVVIWCARHHRSSLTSSA